MLLLALAACTPIRPTDGTYLGEVRDFQAEPGCEDPFWGVDFDALQAANATDVQVAEDGESFTFDDALECTLFDTEFNCLSADETRVSGAALVEQRLVVAGQWITSSAFESDWELSASCEGEDCPDDCLMTWTFDPTLFG